MLAGTHARKCSIYHCIGTTVWFLFCFEPNGTFRLVITREPGRWAFELPACLQPWWTAPYSFVCSRELASHESLLLVTLGGRLACWFQVSHSGVCVLENEGKTLKLNKLNISAPYLPLFTCDKWTKCSCKVTCMYVDRSLNWSIVLRALLELAKQLSAKRSIWGPGDDKLTQQSLTCYFFYFSLSCIKLLSSSCSSHDGIASFSILILSVLKG